MEQLLLAGMHEKLLTKIQEIVTTVLLAVLDKAAELEKLEHDNKNNVNFIAAVSAIPEFYEPELGATATGPVEELAEDEITAIKAIRKNHGRPPFRGKQFKIPDVERDKLHKSVAEWLKLGVVQPSRSKYNSPLFYVA
jgi:hypothetical protein